MSGRQITPTGMNKITTVVFDLDGTLLDSLQDLACSVNHALTEHGMPTRSETEIRLMLGNGVRRLVGQAVPQGTPEDITEQVLATFRVHYAKHCHDLTHPFDGIMDMLAELHRRGYRMAIVSNKPASAVQELNAQFFSGYMNIAVGESTTVRRKPNPDGVLEAIRRMGATPSEAVYVGDSEVDFVTAQNAGIPCITVLWGYRDETFLRNTGATLFARRPSELPELLEHISYNR